MSFSRSGDLELLKLRWLGGGVERFAKKGVDSFDTLGETPQYVGQCKLKENWKSLEPKEIRAEVEKAKKFPSKLDHYAILTRGGTPLRRIAAAARTFRCEQPDLRCCYVVGLRPSSG